MEPKIQKRRSYSTKMSSWTLWTLQVLTKSFHVWDSLWDSIWGSKLLGPRFGVIVPPTEFDVLNSTTVLLWMYRNLAPECVFWGFVAGLICGILLLMLACAGCLFCACLPVLRQSGLCEKRPRAPAEATVPESRTEWAALEAPPLRLRLSNGGDSITLSAEERRALVYSFRQSLARNPWTFAVSTPSADGSRDVSLMAADD